MIDSREASAALADIDDIVQRVRQSRIYNLASQMMIMWGVLVFAGYLVTYLVPRYAFYGWTAVYVVGIAGWALLSTAIQSQSGVHLRREVPARIRNAVCLWHLLLHARPFGPRQISTFWPVYFMMMYSIAGLCSATPSSGSACLCRR
jgi:hypothetical protein